MLDHPLFLGVLFPVYPLELFLELLMEPHMEQLQVPRQV